ncbi:hypothetical protein FHR92_001043 [Fontibacillus solani]|uniref:DUF4355 domain-containing protein n=1 Tax=Fontibacillus solani TaxID=1572857 RepID=A0A7W3SQW0_9BACL|nr:hypothetical protein [Fontibacillus solani]MBA9084586.1 hypothetical protein [Fontibacillus solani]
MELTPEQQAHVEELIADAKSEWETSVLSPLTAERDELLQYKPKQETDEQKEIARLKAELNHQKLVSKLKESNLDDFIDLVNFNDDETEAQKKIEKLNSLLEQRKLNNLYEPDNKRPTTAYDQSAAKGDTVGMLQSKLSKLFG